jgi:hypothetical protein
MDIYCRRCGEPLGLDELHDIPGMTFKEAKDAFYSKGCTGIGFKCNQTGNPIRAELSGILMDLLGDDLDGAAVMLEDAEYGGFFDGLDDESALLDEATGVNDDHSETRRAS